MSSKLEKACVSLCHNLVAVVPYQQEHFLLKLLQFCVMTVNLRPRQACLPPSREVLFSLEDYGEKVGIISVRKIRELASSQAS